MQTSKMYRYVRFCVVSWAISGVVVIADDWPRFRGLAGSGVASDSDSLPSVWSPTANLAWKTPLPGPGASSPIVVGGRVFVTCYSGYGLTQERRGDIENLVRHLVCIDLNTGETIWQKDVQASLPEDSYYGTGVSSHGYASHTPVSDGINVYAFFGKGGVYAFDTNGNELWHANAGKESDPPKWGSSSSPVVYEDTVIVTASAESQSIIGFDKATGQELWRQEAKGLDGMWGTPTLVKVDESRTDLVMLVAKELWGLDPENGKLRWYADATRSQQAYASVIVQGTRLFAFSGQGGGSLALDAGGSGNISDTNTVWTGTVNATYASPVRHRSKLYVVSRGVLSVVDANSGERLKQIRLKGARQTGGRFGSLDYASPVVAGDRLFFLNASGQMYVFGLGDRVQPLAVNEVTTEKEIFWGSPAVSDGRLILRSSKYVYCVADQGDAVKRREMAVPESDVAGSARATKTRDNGGDDVISKDERTAPGARRDSDEMVAGGPTTKTGVPTNVPTDRNDPSPQIVEAMRTSQVIHVVCCHAEGEVGDVIVGGVAPPPGETIWEQRCFIEKDDRLRRFVLNEPRGGVFRHVNLLVPPKNPHAQVGWIMMEPADTPPMSGSNSICVATVVLDTGIVPMTEPETELVMEAPGGLVKARALCRNGKAERITITNVPSFADKLAAPLEVEGLGTLTVDTAYGGDSFVIVDAKALGFEIVPNEANQLVATGMKITAAANEQLGFQHPVHCEWKHVSFCQFAGPLAQDNGELVGSNAVCIRPGKIDRSPTGTGCSARMAVLHAQGRMRVGDRYRARSIIGSEFVCGIDSLTSLGKTDAIVPTVSGRAWITGTRQLMLDPDDPWPEGYRIADTWPVI